MTTAALMRLMRPRHLVVMGGKWAEAVITSCHDMNFEGEIWPVHPTRASINGVKAYASLAELPEAPDAVFLGINRHASIDTVRELAAMGAGGVVAFASGFAEVDDGAELQDELVAAAGDMPVLGPNCYGLINYLDGALLWPDVHGGTRVDRGVAIITQSSNLSINLTMQDGGLPIAYMMTLGNQAMISMADLINAAAEDERVTAIGLHIEGIADAATFAEAVKTAKGKGKPLVAIKAGASEGAQKMTFSHTASLAGSHAVSTAFLARLGVGVIDSIDGFLQALGWLHLFGGIDDHSILTMSCSGGEASLIADAAARHDIPMPPLTDAAAEAVRATVNPLVTVSNPFDYHTFDWGDRDRLTATFTAAMNAGQGISILILDFPSPHLGRAEDWHLALEAWHDAMTASGATAAVLASLPECLPPQSAQWLMDHGVMPLRGFDTALAALAAAHQAAQPAGFMPSGLSELPEGRHVLTEAEAKSALKDHGVAVPEGGVARSLDDALAFTRQHLAVMKIGAAAHKTEQDGVVLNIKGDDATRQAFERLSASGPVLVEAMVDVAVAEVIVGVARDPVLGLHMIVGTGGIMAELTRDTSLIMMPFRRDDVVKALEGRMVKTLIDGFRGKPKGDEKAL
ncbi:MAG: acetate--CoA ligase family protein, partial [Alphaproteobacteria bacterium]|nr:acetate--CoA ligase family protein [Alphaproteobacteria bacterium]